MFSRLLLESWTRTAVEVDSWSPLKRELELSEEGFLLHRVEQPDRTQMKSMMMKGLHITNSPIASNVHPNVLKRADLLEHSAKFSLSEN